MSYQLQEINRRIDQDVKGFLENATPSTPRRSARPPTPF